jgi:GntR family transcriptional regulator/MocR family aminotransferase
LLAIAIERTDSQPLYHQIGDQVRTAIRDGRLKPHDRLPSIRELARQLDVGRITVACAYDDLVAEGYLTARVGSGTEVSSSLPDSERFVEALSQREAGPTDPLKAKDVIELRPQGLGLDLFPTALWGQLVTRAWRDVGRPGVIGEDWSSGDPWLRAVLARYVGVTRGIRTDASQILILTGVTAICVVLARAFLPEGAVCAVEDPGCRSLVDALTSHGSKLVPVPTDAEGLMPRELPDRADMLLASSSWAFPCGGVMPMQRRREVVAWAKRSGAIIYEHDWAGAVRFHGGLLPAIQTLDDASRTIYAASFHEVIPATHVGFAVIPSDLRTRVDDCASPIDVLPSAVEQRALAYFIAEGHLDAHLRRLRVALSSRRKRLASALEGSFASPGSVPLGNAGMQLMVRMPRGTDLTPSEFGELALQRRVSIAPISEYRVLPDQRASLVGGRDGFVIDYSYASDINLRQGVERLGLVWEDLLRARPGSTREPATRLHSGRRLSGN